MGVAGGRAAPLPDSCSGPRRESASVLRRLSRRYWRQDRVRAYTPAAGQRRRPGEAASASSVSTRRSKRCAPLLETLET